MVRNKWSCCAFFFTLPGEEGRSSAQSDQSREKEAGADEGEDEGADEGEGEDADEGEGEDEGADEDEGEDDGSVEEDEDGSVVAPPLEGSQEEEGSSRGTCGLHNI